MSTFDDRAMAALELVGSIRYLREHGRLDGLGPELLAYIDKLVAAATTKREE